MLIDGFNEALNNISFSSLKVGYESMSVILFRTMAKGDIPHLSYIFLKPEPLGEELNTVSCFVTGSLLFIEVQIGKEETNLSKYQQKLGLTAACTKRMTEATKGIVQKSIKGLPRIVLFLTVGSHQRSQE